MEWYFAKDGQRHGPVTEEALREIITDGNLAGSDLVWNAGLLHWLSVSTVFAEIFPPELPPDGVAPAPPHAPALVPEPLPDVYPPRRQGNYFARHWRGELSLTWSVLVNGLLVTILFIGLSYFPLIPFGSVESDYALAAFWGAWNALWVSVSVWQVRGIWAAAASEPIHQHGRGTEVGGRLISVLGATCAAYLFLSYGVPTFRAAVDHGDWMRQYGHWKIALLREGSEIELTGGLGYGIAQEFETALQQAPNVQVVHLNLKHGGLVREAKALYKIIDQHQLSTYVSEECFSACAIAFLGGRERYLKKGARLGFHEPKTPGVRSLDLSDERSMFTNHGVSAEFADRALSAPADSMWYPEESNLLASHAINAVVTGDQFGLSMFRREGMLAKLDSQLQGMPILKAVHDYEPVTYAALMEHMKRSVLAGDSLSDLRVHTVPLIREMRTKYLPLAEDDAVVAYASYMGLVAKTLSARPDICQAYLAQGDQRSSEAALEMYTPQMRTQEMNVIAGLITSSSPNRTAPSNHEKQLAIHQTLEIAKARLGGDMSAIQSLSAPNVRSNQWCRAFGAVYDAMITMPPEQARAAVIGLSE